jgi:hypothetical protein
MTGDAEKLLLAQRLIGELGLRWADVTAPRAIPTISEYLPRVITAATPSQRDKYATYWNSALLLYGGHRRHPYYDPISALGEAGQKWWADQT